MNEELRHVMEQSQQWLRERTKRNAFKRLQSDIIDTHVCTECGACVGSCPVNALTLSQMDCRYVPTLTGECISCGICYTFCPRTFVESSELIGDMRRVLRAQATVRRHGQQDGGAVTALLAFMLERKYIDGAVVASHGTLRWSPLARLATSAEDVLESAGSIYTHAPVVNAMMQALAQGKNRLAVVGTSCNIDAVNKMQQHPAGFFRISKSFSVFRVGLFCTESFDYSRLSMFLQQNGILIDDVTRFTISKGVFRVNTVSGDREWPIAELGSAAAESCKYCLDFTCRHSDLSCGSVGSEEGWTTVLVRTEHAERMIDEAIDAGVIRAETLTDKEIRQVENLARLKMMRIYK